MHREGKAGVEGKEKRYHYRREHESAGHRVNESFAERVTAKTSDSGKLLVQK